MHSVPSLHVLLTMTTPSSHYVTSLYGGSCSHRLKHLEKSDRREFILPSVERKSISPSTFVGNVVALGFSIFLLGGVLWWTCCLGRNRIGQGS